MESEYLRHALLSPLLANQYDAARFGNAVQRLNVEHVRRLGIPLAPHAEQAELLRRVRAALAAQPNALVAQASDHLSVLNQAVLAKAFRGELVPQDPNDEPAEALLSRLRAETLSDPPRARARRSKAAE